MLFVNQRKQKGFTLIELLIVISIIVALSVTIFVALNPTKRLQDARDARRIANVEALLTAIHHYIIDNKGTLPTGLLTGMAETQLGTGNAGQCSPVATGGCTIASSTACVDLTTPLAKYLKSIPQDPKTGSATTTLYSVTIDANNLVTIKACGTEGANNISQSR
ncbi:MAG TPA: type II secretion system protein [Methylomirabilota bacterium]|nr:type II secretion system protein [Methylomirabilota bacterium]